MPPPIFNFYRRLGQPGSFWRIAEARHLQSSTASSPDTLLYLSSSSKHSYRKMKSIKGLGGVNRMLGSVRRRAHPTAPAPQDNSPETTLSTPEENASRSVKLFCESGGPNHTQGDEVLHLPTIVEAAESTPAAARECAYQIRKCLSQANAPRPYVQYNAVMLMRILSDNPGPMFTKNIDKKFVETVKTLVRFGTDPSVQQILRETLDNLERDKKSDTNLVQLLEMWAKEKVKIQKVLSGGSQHGSRASIYSRGPQPNYPSSSRPAVNRLPNPEELASRVEEAKTSAKILTQLVQSTPPTELLSHELVREFAERCRGASRSIQTYMNAENPTPDNDTMLTLIETNEQLSVAISTHQRSILQARKAMGRGNPVQGPTPSASPDASMGRAPNMVPPPSASMPPPPPQPRKPVANAPPNTEQSPGPSTSVAASENPFRDEAEVEPAIDHNEPYHTGFNPTRSYMGRQDSAVNKVAMHAAIPAVSPVNGSEERVPPNLGQAAADRPPEPAQERGPVYRYQENSIRVVD